jgi:hypothetical protein
MGSIFGAETRRRLIVPRGGRRDAHRPDDAAQLALGVEAFDYTIDASDGFETFHASW